MVLEDFRIRKDEVMTEDTELHSVGYTCHNGNVNPKNMEFINLPEVPVNDSKCYAKLLVLNSPNDTPRYKYYVKAGGAQGHLYEINGLYSENTDDVTLKRKGKNLWDFVEVSRTTFENYIKYLKTNNKAWYNMANREARNG